jgi:hypothetical protein
MLSPPFKARSTVQINAARDSPGARVWQRSFYEAVVRTSAAVKRCRAYIADNPRRWSERTRAQLEEPQANHYVTHSPAR